MVVKARHSIPAVHQAKDTTMCRPVWVPCTSNVSSARSAECTVHPLDEVVSCRQTTRAGRGISQAESHEEYMRGTHMHSNVQLRDKVGLLHEGAHNATVPGMQHTGACRVMVQGCQEC
jgi:hypothetical protein